MNILMVGNDKEVLLKFEKVLAPIGNVDIFNNFNKCKDKIHEYYMNNQSYDLVVIDLDMPESSGLQILKKIRNNEESLGIEPRKVLLLSSSNNTSAVLNFFSFDYDIFIEKNIDEKDIYKYL